MAKQLPRSKDARGGELVRFSLAGGSRSPNHPWVVAQLILVVDDDDDVREAIAGLLQDVGYAVEEASDGRAALQRLAAPPPPVLVILDLMMPDMSGAEVLAAWQLNPELPRCRVLVLTASSPAFVASLDLHHPTLHKPFDLDVLLQRVSELADGVTRSEGGAR